MYQRIILKHSATKSPLNVHGHQCVFSLCFPVRTCLSGTVGQYNIKLNPVTEHQPLERESSGVMGDTCFSNGTHFPIQSKCQQIENEPRSDVAVVVHTSVWLCVCVCVRRSMLHKIMESAAKQRIPAAIGEKHLTIMFVLEYLPGYDGCPCVGAGRWK